MAESIPTNRHVDDTTYARNALTAARDAARLVRSVGRSLCQSNGRICLVCRSVAVSVRWLACLSVRRFSGCRSVGLAFGFFVCLVGFVWLLVCLSGGRFAFVCRLAARSVSFLCTSAASITRQLLSCFVSLLSGGYVGLSYIYIYTVGWLSFFGVFACAWFCFCFVSSFFYVFVFCYPKPFRPYRTALPLYGQETWNLSRIEVSVRSTTKRVICPF